MKKTTLIILLLSAFQNLFSQTIQTYTGVYKNGTATYDYYEKDYERILNGKFNYKFKSSMEGECSVTGQYKENKRVGTWDFEKYYPESNMMKQVQKTRRTKTKGSYLDGKMNGNWSILKIEEPTGKKLMEVVLTFNKGLLIDSFYYSSELDKIKIRGLFDKDGFFDGTWVADYESNNKPLEQINRYKHGVLCFLLRRNLSEGTVEKKVNISSFVDSLYSLMDTTLHTCYLRGNLVGISGDDKSNLQVYQRLDGQKKINYRFASGTYGSDIFYSHKIFDDHFFYEYSIFNIGFKNWSDINCFPLKDEVYKFSPQKYIVPVTEWE